MPFWRLYYHATWGTKDRQPILSDEIENDVYRLITAKAQDMGAVVYVVNGMSDHVHIVASVPPSLALADWIKEIKGNSSHAINNTHPDASLQWQAGYGILSFGQKTLGTVIDYVLGQKEHHAANTLIHGLEHADLKSDGPQD